MEWIKCSDRMPDNYTEILAWIVTRECQQVLHFNDGLFEDDEYLNHEVSHWQPLPPNPIS